MGISFEGNVKGFLNVMAQVVEGQRLEVPVSPLLRLKGIEKYITLSVISIMMLGVLVLLGAKARGLLLRSNVKVLRLCVGALAVK
jgi:hypothetical protein